jgi:hypothetical protein
LRKLVLDDVLLEKITSYNQRTLMDAINFVAPYWNEASTDLSADYPNYDDGRGNYNYVHHQAKPKIVEARV